ncbi:Hercynylcysteine sulfoxide lyase [Psilocybe cubensis]|uniref:Aminotransferase class V domain-containing protein n=2 Tax=Psilocybe cubensis TaxID=181762 RepID=A0A8H7XSP6_PSICU|nr:Hercynylcysteine sulfoxide lyase [Psilocybe cubensis]KAH9479107.1 Hercynylcysteine sulfoxide lyase [Psilocybe cubensis]
MAVSSRFYANDVPEFGHKMLKYFALDPDYINLNNGSYGTTPKPVQLAVDELTEKIEACPDLFHKFSYLPMLVESRARVASLIGAKTDEVVFVENASMGINTILRNFEWEEGDMIISCEFPYHMAPGLTSHFSTTYNAVSRTIQHISDVLPHPTSSVINLTFPTTHKEIIQQFRTHLRSHPAMPGRRRVVVIDSIVSNPGVLLPWKEMVQICKEERAWSVVDAAHSIGQEVGIDLTQSAPDFWVSHIVRSAIPTSALYSSPLEPVHYGFAKQFEWTGTIDWTRCLTVPDALDFRKWMGGEEKINAYCHDLAINGGKILAQIFGTSMMDPDGELTLNMVNVELPLSGNITAPLGVKMHASLLHKMLVEKKAFAALFYHNGRWWIRCSAQVWNESEDFEKIGKLWLQACKDVKEEFQLTR